MSERAFYRTAFFFAVLLAGIVSVLPGHKSVQPTFASEDPPALSALMYSDRSGGAFFHAYVWHEARSVGNTNITYTHDAVDFVNRLNTGNWSTVAVMARHTSNEPAFLTELRG